MIITLDRPHPAPSPTTTGSTIVTASPALDAIPVIDLVHPMPGFPEERRFALVQVDESGMLATLRSLDRDGLEFLVTPPAAFFPEYAPVLDDETVTDLGIGSPDDVLVLVVLRAGASLAETTANLRAPVVINVATRQASQVILDDPQLSVAVPLVA